MALGIRKYICNGIESVSKVFIIDTDCEAGFYMSSRTARGIQALVYMMVLIPRASKIV